jgi:hypothetical protein
MLHEPAVYAGQLMLRTLKALQAILDSYLSITPLASHRLLLYWTRYL